MSERERTWTVGSDAAEPKNPRTMLDSDSETDAASDGDDSLHEDTANDDACTQTPRTTTRVRTRSAKTFFLPARVALAPLS
jgi:hypothetical protein